MKKLNKLNFTFAFLLILLTTQAQTHWTVEPITVNTGETAGLGTANKRSINLVTNDTIRAVADSIGLFQIKRLAGKGYRLVYVDSLGNLGARGGGGDGGEDDSNWNACDEDAPVAYNANPTDGFKCPSKPCLANAGPWYEGGNKIGNSGNNTIGTCNVYDFVLKSNGTDRVWIKTDGKVGVGTSAPSGNFEVQNATNAEIIASNSTANPASTWVINTGDSYGLLIDNSGFGHISQNRGSSQHNLLGFKYNSSNTIPEQVWIGTRPTTGTAHTDFNLCVGGKALCKSLYVSVVGTWADYVFSKDYKLKPLNEVESFILKNGHLPGAPGAKEIEEKEYSLNIADVQKMQMEKIEELFLYTIKLQKEVEELRSQNERLIKLVKK